MKTIFIVDDNDSNLIVAKTALDGIYKTFALPSAEKMFKLAEKITPDLILLDVDMPGMDGFETISILKADAKLKSIPVIFLTAKNDAESEIRGFELGADDYIFKPISDTTIKLRVRNQIKMVDQMLQLHEARANAEAATTAKSYFLARMSHEIRTPMNAIIGMSELLFHESLNEYQMGCVNDIRESSQALLSIVNDILDMSKIEAGKMTLAPIHYDLKEMTDNIASMFLYIAHGG
jgi:DNA-binding response OmpR family regulator